MQQGESPAVELNKEGPFHNDNTEEVDINSFKGLRPVSGCFLEMKTKTDPEPRKTKKIETLSTTTFLSKTRVMCQCPGRL